MANWAQKVGYRFCESSGDKCSEAACLGNNRCGNVDAGTGEHPSIASVSLANRMNIALRRSAETDHQRFPDAIAFPHGE